MIRVYIGYDARETVAFHVAAHSLYRHASVPVSIVGLRLSQLPLLTRAREGSTEFTFSRFLVPFLCGYEGTAIFMDCDVLCRFDVADLLEEHRQNDDLGNGVAVSVVQHRYVPKPGPKFLGNAQAAYPRKNWSSVIVFNNGACSMLTPHIVNTMPGLWLHQFQWLEDDQIGNLPVEWNHLVGEYEPNPDARLAHYTRGGPWFEEFSDCEFADEWRAERKAMLGVG